MILRSQERSTGGQNDEHGVHQVAQNRQVYSVEGADAVIFSVSSFTPVVSYSSGYGKNVRI